MLPDETIEHLLGDDELYARRCLQVVDDRTGRFVPLEPRPAQLKVARAAAAQRAAGKPIRLIVLKSRRTGVSTWVQGCHVRDATLIPNTTCLTVAHDKDTAAWLHGIAEQMYVKLPGHLDARLKPPLAQQRNSKEDKWLLFGEPSKILRQQGELGVNSTLAIATASEAGKGRGFGIRRLHLSEAAFYTDPDVGPALISTVPDVAGTSIVIESTANGTNDFKARWDAATRGEGSFVPVFISWLEDPNCARPFDSPAAAAAFVDSIGSGPWGEDEPELQRLGATPEQLHWRRTAIVDKSGSKLAKFKQEYPSNPDEAFTLSGKHVFAVPFIVAARNEAERFDPEHPAALGQVRTATPPVGTTEHVPAAVGLLQASGHRSRKRGIDTLEVPSGTLWVPREATGFRDEHPMWKVWAEPVTWTTDDAKPPDERRPEGQYIIACDPMSGEETSAGEKAYHAIQVIDHRTGEQQASWRARIDPDQLGDELFLAGLWWNTGWIVVEMTGGYGIAPYNRLAKLGYPRLYNRVRSHEHRYDDDSPKLGWSTDRKTKPMLEAGMAELLRETTHGIRCLTTALELTTYVQSDRGRTGPESGAFADLLMALMIAHEVRREKPLRPVKRPGEQASRSGLQRTLPPQWQR